MISIPGAFVVWISAPRSEYLLFLAIWAREVMIRTCINAQVIYWFLEAFVTRTGLPNCAIWAAVAVIMLKIPRIFDQESQALRNWISVVAYWEPAAELLGTDMGLEEFTWHCASQTSIAINLGAWERPKERERGTLDMVLDWGKCRIHRALRISS